MIIILWAPLCLGPPQPVPLTPTVRGPEGLPTKCQRIIFSNCKSSLLSFMAMRNMCGGYFINKLRYH